MNDTWQESLRAGPDLSRYQTRTGKWPARAGPLAQRV
jgi:hypothetical protein